MAEEDKKNVFRHKVSNSLSPRLLDGLLSKFFIQLISKNEIVSFGYVKLLYTHLVLIEVNTKIINYIIGNIKQDCMHESICNK